MMQSCNMPGCPSRSVKHAVPEQGSDSHVSQLWRNIHCVYLNPVFGLFIWPKNYTYDMDEVQLVYSRRPPES